MRGLFGVNRRLLLLALAPAFLAGCASDSAPMKTDPATVMNKTGQPPTNLPPGQEDLAAKQKAAGEAANNNMNEQMRAMKEAKARSGGR